MPTLGWRFAHMFALSGMAVAQPTLSLLGDNPTFFTAHDAGTAEIIWFAALLVAVPPAVGIGISAAAHRVSAPTGEWVHLGLVGLFAFLFVLPVADDLPGPWPVVIVVAAAIAGGVVTAYRRFQGLRSVVSVLAVAPFAFVGFFLFASPVEAVVFPDDVEAVALDDLVDDLTDDPGTDDPERIDAPRTLAERVNDQFPPVYLLVLDELPWPSLVGADGSIDADRYPNFARLGATSTVFTDATAPAFSTELSVPMILTGRDDREDAPVYSLYPDNLFTLLGGVYDASSSDPLVDLCPPSVCNGSPPADLIELLASAPDPTTTTAPPTVAPTPDDESPSEAPDDNSPFDLLLEDAAIVFGHLVTPDDLDIGLPSIGSSWGSFGRGVGTDEPATVEPPPPDEAPTSTTTSLAVDVTAVATDDDGPVDIEAIEDARTALLDSLITNDVRVADLRAEIAAMSDPGVPRLHYLHVLLPHVPWRHHAEGSIYADIGLPGYFDEWSDSPEIAALGQQRHLLQLQFTDRLLGEYLDRLEALGVFDRATIIVTADHGISFLPGQRSRGVFEANSGGIAPVPLIWKQPEQTRGETIDAPVTLLDVVPTLAAQLGVDIPWEVDGIDLFGDLPDERTRVVAMGSGTELPAHYPDLVDAVIADLHERFGTGASGSVYAVGGSPELIGRPAAEFSDGVADGCWRLERPPSTPEPGGEIGYVFGTITSPDPEQVPFAIVVDGVITGTSTSYAEQGAHRVYGLGDPRHWRSTPSSTIELHELRDGRLLTIPRC